MSCGTPLTAVAVGLSTVALDDEEVKTPSSIWHAATAKCAIAVSYQRLYLYRSDKRKLRHIYVVICPGCKVLFPLQILHTSHCFPHASSSLTHCVSVLTQLVHAVDLTNNLFTSYHSPPPSYLMCFVTPVLLCLAVQSGESALQIVVREGHLDVLKVLIQVYRDSHVESEIDQNYMDLTNDHHHQHVVGYLSTEFPSLKRKVSHHSLHKLAHAICCCLTACLGGDTLPL